MTKKILVLIAAIFLVGTAFFIFGKKIAFSPTATTTPTNTASEQTGLGDVNIKPNVPSMTLPLSNDPKDVAWAVFQKYLEYNKSRDIDGVRSVVYKIAPVCEDPKTRVDCEGRMGSAYAYGSTLKKEDFTNVWSDSKQIILSTDFKTTEDDSIIERNRAIIFFVRDDAGDLKLLSFSPFKGVIVDKELASEQELHDRVITYTEDKDQDGISDYNEECLGIKEGQTCTKTDSKLRDTDGDGWWDGVEALMK